jgi:type VI secretion system secreted protein VgrG
LALTTPRCATVQGSALLDLASLRDVQVSAGKRLALRALESVSLFARKAGLKLLAAGGDIQLQAQDGDTQILASRLLHLLSTQKEVRVEAPESILLRAGGAYLRLGDGKIEMGCPGGITFRTGKAEFMAGASQNPDLPQFKSSEVEFTEFFRLLGPDGEPLAGAPYQVTFEDGTQEEGRTDAQGYTPILLKEMGGSVQLSFGGSGE